MEVNSSKKRCRFSMEERVEAGRQYLFKESTKVRICELSPKYLFFYF